MTEFQIPEDADELHRLVLRLWSKAQDGPEYEKGEWLSLQAGVWNLLGLTPLDDLEEPPSWCERCDEQDSQEGEGTAPAP